MSAGTFRFTAKPIPGSRAFIGMATRYGNFVGTCGHPAGHLHPEDALICVNVMATTLTGNVRGA